MSERREIRTTEGDQLWPLVALLVSAHYDDVAAAMPELLRVVHRYRITDSEGRLLIRTTEQKG